ncbi:MAG: DNRLRE domain-containing protein, partial [Pseudomonadota bacterium]
MTTSRNAVPRFGQTAAMVLVLAAGWLVPGAADAQFSNNDGEAVVAPSAVATLYENDPDANGGGYDTLCVGNQGSASSTRSALFRFDLPRLAPFDSLNSVNIEMRQLRVRDSGSGPKPATLEVYRVLEPWTEGSGAGQNAACGGGSSAPGVTWNTQPATAPTPSAVIAVPASDDFGFRFNNGFIDSVGLMADVSYWRA